MFKIQASDRIAYVIDKTKRALHKDIAKLMSHIDSMVEPAAGSHKKDHTKHFFESAGLLSAIFSTGLPSVVIDEIFNALTPEEASKAINFGLTQEVNFVERIEHIQNEPFNAGVPVCVAYTLGVLIYAKGGDFRRVLSDSTWQQLSKATEISLENSSSESEYYDVLIVALKFMENTRRESVGPQD